MRPPHLTLVPAANVKRAVTAVRRALMGSRPADPERIWDPDELGAIMLPELPQGVEELANRLVSASRARPRLARVRSAPPAWRLHRRRFGELLAQAAPFDSLSPALALELGQVADWVAVSPGETLFQEGQPLEHVYVVAQGRFDLVRRQAAGTLGAALPGSALGLCSSLGADGALATARTPLGGSALRLPLALLAEAALCEPAFRNELRRLGDVRRLCHLLAASALADLCGATGRAGIAAMFSRRKLGKGEPLFLEGQVQNGLALVETGGLALWVRSGAGGGERPAAFAGPGQALGVLAALRSRPCAGTLRAVDQTEVAVLDHQAFRQLLDWNPSLQGLPALLYARQQLLSGSFFSISGGQPASRPAWLRQAGNEAIRVA